MSGIQGSSFSFSSMHTRLEGSRRQRRTCTTRMPLTSVLLRRQIVAVLEELRLVHQLGQEPDELGFIERHFCLCRLS